MSGHAHVERKHGYWKSMGAAAVAAMIVTAAGERIGDEITYQRMLAQRESGTWVAPQPSREPMQVPSVPTTISLLAAYALFRWMRRPKDSHGHGDHH